jgi:hypothetical protein
LFSYPPKIEKIGDTYLDFWSLGREWHKIDCEDVLFRISIGKYQELLVSHCPLGKEEAEEDLMDTQQIETEIQSTIIQVCYDHLIESTFIRLRDL